MANLTLKQEKSVIYGLIDPEDDQLKYIGYSKQLMTRYKQHCQLRANAKFRTNRCRWLTRLLSRGIKPELIIIEENVADWHEAERFWIGYFKMIGAKLTNGNDGGIDLSHANGAEKLTEGQKIARYAHDCLRQFKPFDQWWNWYQIFGPKKMDIGQAETLYRGLVAEIMESAQQALQLDGSVAHAL